MFRVKGRWGTVFFLDQLKEAINQFFISGTEKELQKWIDPIEKALLKLQQPEIQEQSQKILQRLQTIKRALPEWISIQTDVQKILDRTEHALQLWHEERTADSDTNKIVNPALPHSKTGSSCKYLNVDLPRTGRQIAYFAQAALIKANRIPSSHVFARRNRFSHGFSPNIEGRGFIMPKKGERTQEALAFL